VAENVAYLQKKQDVLDPLGRGQTEELAYLMAQITEDPEDREELHRIWSEALSVVNGRMDPAELAKSYYAALKPKRRERQNAGDVTSICYLRNRGSDGAFDHFTLHLPKVRAIYASGHEEALENCYDEYSDACILPFSDPERGLHTGFRSMIARYGLKIQSMVRVENREGTALDLVLLRREVAIPAQTCYLAVTLPLSDGTSLAEPLRAAGCYGLCSDCIMRLPELYASADSYDLHFYGKSEAIEQYLFYLALTHPRYDLLGIYQKERENI